MENKTIIILVVAVIAIAAIGFLIATRWVAQEIYEDVADMTGTPAEGPSVTYDVDLIAGTMTITSIEGDPEELLWSNVELADIYVEFQATLPIGTIDEGDVITDCEGPILLIWKPTGSFFIDETFN